MLCTGDGEGAYGVPDGTEEFLHTNVRVAVTWNSILRSNETKMLRHDYSVVASTCL
jgi:hypothetical protein